MKTLLFFVLLFISEYASGIYSITVYGTNSCGYTTALRNDLTKENISFSYCNIETTECFNQLKNVVYEFNLAVDNYVDLPVVKITVDGKSYGFVRPNINVIKQMITPTSSIITPNPVQGIITINTYPIKSIEIYNLAGVRMMCFNNNNNIIDVGYLVTGCYIMKINKNIIVKFLKQ